jgi:DNA-binding NtrC family response regulator
VSRASILIIDDEENLRQLLARIIELEGYEVHQATNIKTAWRALEREVIHVIIIDVKLPDGNGVELTGEIKSKYPAIEIIVLTAFGTIHDGVRAIKNGAFDYLTKGDHQDKILPLLSRASEKALLSHQVAALQKRLSTKFGFDHILGQSKAIADAIALAKKVAATDTTVLLTGETGTGKEVFAQAIHYEGRRHNKPVVAVNCSALGKDILDSELFGHREGAFTGATRDRIGLFKEADGGTIFLDEIGEMHVDLQAKLLRVLESGTFIRVGDTKETKVDVRVIAATNRSLDDEIKDHHFRTDLFYRLSVFQIQLPSLRERRDDVPALAEYFYKLFGDKTNKTISGMSKEFIAALKDHPWKGNVRELKNIIERAVILSDFPTLRPDVLPSDFNVNSNGTALDLESVERNHIQKVLANTNGNKTQAAKILNIGLTTLYQKIKDYNLV